MTETRDELVALYDRSGAVVGEVARSVMRRENLWHAASSVVVRDPFGRIYLHRRTTTKDVYPGLLDFAAGGVVLAGEDPPLGAVREAEEELGVHGVRFEPWGVVAYEDEHTRYHAHRFTVEWDGPVRWQPEEVSWGDWIRVDELVQRLDDDPGSVVPDSAAVWGGVLRAWQADRVVLSQGWDCEASLVEGRWVDRAPRRPDVERQLLSEAALLPVIADALDTTGVEVPQPQVVRREPLTLRHPLVAGSPADPEQLTPDDGKRLGEFLRALHRLDLSVIASTGVPSAADDVGDRAEQL
ncbi:MAG TPA: NUDIX domain-containing protein, partial [Humibacillus sp.]|nr:NUDIX domain-containing protein [Humibacillus sp.]